jgi:hypothetical protein
MKIYKSELAEKILLSGEEFKDQTKDSFHIGGKILFDDLSSLRSIHNLNFLEKQIPKGIMAHEYFEINVLKKTDDSGIIVNNINNKVDGFKLTALRVIPSYQDQAEFDYKSVVFLHNGDCAVEEMDGSYRQYDKSSANSFYASYNLDPHLITKKLTRDIDLKNELKQPIKLKM